MKSINYSAELLLNKTTNFTNSRSTNNFNVPPQNVILATGYKMFYPNMFRKYYIPQT